jgi:hypothetical protein
MSEPIPVLPLEYEQVDATRAHAGRWLRLLVVLSSAACAVATALIPVVDVETVIISGPVIFVMGAAILIAAMRVRSPWHAVLGAGHCAICLLFFMFANWMGWGPPEARVPFAIMGLAYTLLSGVASFWLILRTRPRR